MREGFLKALKWYILVLAAIIGTSAFMISSDTDSVKPVLIGVLSYGVVYIMATFWKEFRDKILLLSAAVFLVISFASPYIPYVLYLLFGYDHLAFNQYYTWAWSMAVFGIPVMTFVFKKYD